MLARTVIAAIVLAVAAQTASAQIGIKDRSDPFLHYNQNGFGGGGSLFGAGGGGAGSGGYGAGPLQGRIAIKFPEAVSVTRPLKLRPPKPVLVLEGERAADQQMLARTIELRDVARKLEAARRAGDFTKTMRLLREMESVRQRRLERVRTIAKRIVPEPDETGDAPTVPDAGSPPILPIPTAPKN